jgi:muramidase (phage lysozyme)
MLFSATALAQTDSDACESNDMAAWLRGIQDSLWMDEPGPMMAHNSSHQEALSSPLELSLEERAALATIRYAEGGEYNRMFGWFEDNSRVFDPLTQVGHPNSPYTSRGGSYTSSAAGAYQAMPATWNEEVQKGTISDDFRPANQDRFALARLEFRGLLDEVQAGDTSWITSVQMGREWASFPGSPYGQPSHSASDLHSYYTQKLREYGQVN